MIVYDNQLGRYGRFNRYGYAPAMPGYNTTPPIVATDDTPSAIIDHPAGMIDTPSVMITAQGVTIDPATAGDCAPAAPSKISPWIWGTGALVVIAALLGR